MKKLKNMALACIVTLTATTNAYAVDCGPAKILHIQPQQNEILFYPEGQSWHLLGHNDAPGVKEMYSALLAAQMAGKRVTVRYPGSYDCGQYELTTPALMVRTHTN